VLDLTRPATGDHAPRAIDDTLGGNPTISYAKWDANRYVTQPGSTYLGPDEQSHLLIDYNRSLYDLDQLGRILPAPPPNRPLNKAVVRVKQLTFLVQTHAETRPKRLSAPAAAG